MAALAAYDGPTAFAIPGNHDWIDGLETFQRYIQHRGWLGGWLLPQEKSYFALRLPHGWWLFGLDLALVDDIDMCQCQYFARIADERMGPSDQARTLGCSSSHTVTHVLGCVCLYANTLLPVAPGVAVNHGCTHETELLMTLSGVNA